MLRIITKSIENGRKLSVEHRKNIETISGQEVVATIEIGSRPSDTLSASMLSTVDRLARTIDTRTEAVDRDGTVFTETAVITRPTHVEQSS